MEGAQGEPRLRRPHCQQAWEQHELYSKVMQELRVLETLTASPGWELTLFPTDQRAVFKAWISLECLVTYCISLFSFMILASTATSENCAFLSQYVSTAGPPTSLLKG